jgi:prepilin-type N-terminal cleavage/methylation domain-containing protein
MVFTDSKPCSLTGQFRRAFTLLEVLLASTIAVLIMSALYVAVNMQLRHAQAGRDVIEKSTLARAILARVANDIASSLPPPLPANSTSSSKSGGASPSTGASGASGTSGSAQGTSSAASSGSNSPSSGVTSTSSTTAANAVTINSLVQGDAQTVTLSISRYPHEVMNLSQDVRPLSDERMVTYWLAGSGSGGLARQEIKQVTSSDALANLAPNVSDEGSFVIAPEVRSLAFRYFDGANWNDSWDGTSAGQDGSTAIGPPVAIEITLGVGMSTTDDRPDADKPTKTYRRVVFLPTANGATTPSAK